MDQNPISFCREDVLQLEARLREAEETLNAIRNGDVDAVVVGGPAGQQVYTLENADRPYRVLIEQMQEGAVTLGQDGTVLYCNQRLATIIGMQRESILGQNFDVVLTEAERDVFHGLLSRGTETGMSAEFTLRAVGGTVVPVNISLIDLKVEDGGQRVVCAVVTDLTQNRRRNDELAAANAHLAREIEERSRAEDSLRVALGAAGMGSWDLDLATDAARRSPRHDEIFGYDAQLPDFGLRAALAHFLAEDRADIAKAFADAEADGAIDIVRRIRRAGDNAVRWVHIKGRTYYDGAKPVRIAGVIADVTDSRAVEDQLRQSQKMEAVGQLTGGIAHDFNNLLMIIGGSLDLLYRRSAKDARTSALVEAARQGVARGAKLNQQLLAFSRRQDLRTESVCVNDLIPEFEHLLDRAMGEAVTVVVAQEPVLWSCSTDAHQLETAILNLAINARDAMPHGGTLTLKTANETIGKAAAAGCGAEPGDFVVVSVTDTGTGMTPDIVARVFEPFFTTKEVGKGTGLGLSQVYGFAKQSGGFVTIDTAPGKGTSLKIYLPRTDAAQSVADPLEALPMGPDGQGTILVVEDDPAVRATTSALVRDLGYHVVEAATAGAALALIDGAEPIALVFTDVIMPGGMNGVELATEIGQRRPNLPVLLTSGYTAQRLIPDSATKAWPLLRKPYTQVELALAISDTLERMA